jgi:hypothetical protein
VFYEYRIIAMGAQGPVSTSQPVQYLAPPFTTVTNLTLTGTSTRADLGWTAAYGVAGYQVGRRTIKPDGSIGSQGQLTTQPLAAPGFSDPTVLATELYEYQVVSVTPDGATWPSNWIRYIAPAAPVATIAGAGDRVILTWTSTGTATGYHVGRYALDQTGKRTSGGQLTTTPVVADNYADAVPVPALYEYQVIAVLPDGSRVPSSSVTIGMPAFTTPVGVTAAAIGARGVVAWYPALSVTGYQIWRRFIDPVGRASQPVQLGTVPPGGTGWLDLLPDLRSSVEYQVIGLSTDGRSWPSAWVRGR